MQLDGLRTCAVFIVMVQHFTGLIESINPGVWLFFVLSGFLITRVLVNERYQECSTFGPKIAHFYLRRALRILPPYFALLLVAAVFGQERALSELVWHLTFTSNVLFAIRDAWTPGLAHFWTLAVEEQFYLFWPFIILLVPRQHLVSVVVAVALISAASRGLLATFQSSELMAIILMPTAAVWLAAGALLALVPGAMDRAERRPSVVPILISAASAWLAMMEVPEPYTEPLGSLGWIVPMVLLVRGGWIGFEGVAGAFLANPVVTYLGRISYGIYLFHLPVGYLLPKLAERIGIWELSGLIRFSILAAVSVFLAACSWHLLEQPINRIRKRVD